MNVFPRVSLAVSDIALSSYVGPNISGRFDIRRWGNGQMLHKVGGAFYSAYEGGDSADGVAKSGVLLNEEKITFNASNSNASYSGSKLQVPALQLLACIRV